MHTTGLMVVLAITVMLMVGIACNGPRLATPPEIAIATAVPEPSPTRPSAPPRPEPSPTRPSIDGATWILESIDGQPPIAGTYSTLTVNGLEWTWILESPAGSTDAIPSAVGMNLEAWSSNRTERFRCHPLAELTDSA